MDSSRWSVQHFFQHMVGFRLLMYRFEAPLIEVFVSRGVVNTYGAYQTFCQTGFLGSKSTSNISWIGSLQSFFLLFVGAITGTVYDAGYLRSLLWIGAGSSVFGMMMTSICVTY